MYAKKVIKLKINVYNTIPKRNLIDYKKFKTINVAGIDLWFNHFFSGLIITCVGLGDKEIKKFIYIIYFDILLLYFLVQNRAASASLREAAKKVKVVFQWPDH